MDDPLILLGWTLGGTLGFGVLGAVFGGLAGRLSWRAGHATGSVIGRRLADALSRLREGQLTEIQRGTLIGAVDGAFFLGLAGTLIGLGATVSGRAPASWLVPLFLIAVALAGGALLFGGLAAGIVRLRVRAIFGIVLGGISGALVAAHQIGVLHIVPGAVAGLFLGFLVTLIWPY